MGPFGYGFPQEGVPDRGWKLFITAVIFIILSGICVVSRLYLRIKRRSFGIDDGMVVLALLSSICASTMTVYSVSWGFGVTEKYLTDTQADNAIKWFYFTEVLYKTSLMFSKTSILFLYLRIFITKSFRTVCWSTMAVVVSWCIASIVTITLQCIPIQASWDYDVANPQCIDLIAFFYAYGVINILTDIWILLLPVRQVSRLQADKSTKWGVCIVFMLGGIVCALCITRMLVAPWGNQGRANPDRTNEYFMRPCVGLPEMNMSIVCACLPTLHLPAFLSKRIESHSRSNSKKSGSGSRGSRASRFSAIRRPTFTWGGLSPPGRGGATSTTITSEGPSTLSAVTTATNSPVIFPKRSTENEHIEDDIELGGKVSRLSFPVSPRTVSRPASARTFGGNTPDSMASSRGGDGGVEDLPPLPMTTFGTQSDEDLLSRMQDMSHHPNGDIIVTFSYNVRRSTIDSNNRRELGYDR